MLAIAASVVFVLIALAHSVLGEAEILRPLFARPWDIGVPRFAAERVLRFAWHLTSIAWVGLAAALVGVSIVDALGFVSLISGLIILFMLRGHLAWPMFLFVAAAAWASAGALPYTVTSTVIFSATAVAMAAAALHAYWAFGGQWGLDVAVPAAHDGTPAFRPGPVACLSVAGACVVLAAVLAWPAIAPTPMPVIVMLTTAAVLLAIRAVGDGRQSGFSKQDRSTRYAQADDAIYTPLFTLLLFGALGSLYLAALPRPNG